MGRALSWMMGDDCMIGVSRSRKRRKGWIRRWRRQRRKRSRRRTTHDGDSV